MATPSGSPDTDVRAPRTIAAEIEDRLREEPFCFEFFQTVRLLERLWPHRAPVGEFAHPSEEVARFRANPSLAFPASEIQAFEETRGSRPVLTVNFLGSLGPNGALPLCYSELIGERLQARDHTLLDFLDIFHHRIISLFYRAWRKYRFQFEDAGGDLDHFSEYLLDLLGLGTVGLQRRQTVRDESLLGYCGLLGQQPRSATALRLLLSDYFQVPVEIQQFVGAWYRLDDNAQCCLNEMERDSSMLGFGAVVGDEVWEPQARVRIIIGPVKLAKYLDFLPTGTAHEPLRAIVRLFSGDQIDFELQLFLDRNETPPCELGSGGDSSPRLGLLSWAKSKPMNRDPGDAILQL
jgi:type VI secretion system protein ImpH